MAFKTCNKKSGKGFTLVEIIVVLVILAILAAATIPSMLGFIKDSKYASLDNEASAVRTAAQAYATEHSAKGDSDSDIESAIYGVIKPGHALYSLLQNDVNGMIYEPKVESGKIKGFKYTKAVIDENEDEDFISNGDVQLTKFDADSSRFIHASERIASINIEDFKAGIIASVADSLTSSLTADLTSSLTSSLKTDITSNLKTNFRAELGSNVVDLIYPVGSYYVSNNSTSPAKLFGGTWTKVVDKFLRCVEPPDEDNVITSDTGGNSTHTHTTGDHILTVDQIPSHSHSIRPCIQAIDDANNSLNKITAARPSADWCDSLVNVGSTGGGQAHNHGNTGSASNLPPYLTVYCWRRTA